MSSAITLLDGSHYSALRMAIINVLDTELAVAAFAQIIDGLPTEHVAWDRSRHELEAEHPLSDHKQLCPGFMNKFNAIKAEFQIDSLEFDASLLEAFRSAKPASHNFKLRLLELTAVSIHQIAVYLFQLEVNLHDQASTRGLDVNAVVELQPEPDDFFNNVDPCRTHFALQHFTAHKQYPHGIADMVAYWAEDRILGGVAIFDHSETWTPDNEPNVYLQSCRKWATWRIWQLLLDQQEDLVRFLLREPHSSTDPTEFPDGPLPIMPSRANTVRINPSDAIPIHKVYRDIWERGEPPQQLRMQQFITPCVVNSDDYPEMEDTAEYVKRLNERRNN